MGTGIAVGASKLAKIAKGASQNPLARTAIKQTIEGAGDAVSSAAGQYIQQGKVDATDVIVDVVGGRVGSAWSSKIETKNAPKGETLKKQVDRLEKQSERKLNPTRTQDVKNRLNAAKKELSSHERSVTLKTFVAGTVGSNTLSKTKEIITKTNEK